MSKSKVVLEEEELVIKRLPMLGSIYRCPHACGGGPVALKEEILSSRMWGCFIPIFLRLALTGLEKLLSIVIVWAAQSIGQSIFFQKNNQGSPRRGYMFFQLNLFSNKPDPLPSAKNQKSQSTPKVIRICSTAQAAILLGVHVTTLHRARQAGQPYKRNGGIAEAIGRNRWRVILSSSLKSVIQVPKK